MSGDSLWGQVREEMQKDGLGLLEQVLALMIGGVLGGKALAIADSNLPMRQELFLFGILFSTGFAVLGITHLVVSVNRVVGSKDETPQ